MFVALIIEGHSYACETVVVYFCFDSVLLFMLKYERKYFLKIKQSLATGYLHTMLW